MGRAFAEITFTPSVKAAQTHYGSRRSNKGYEAAPERQDELTEFEREFIQQRDGFFQASVSETGWPYVQFRGGAPGFLKVIDSKTIGFADFRGNIQYLSVGNINATGRVALILLDQAHPGRLKIWGHARVIDRTEDPDLVASLQVPGYKATVERGIIISVEAFDWNCPQHITPRFTDAEIQERMEPFVAELTKLRSKAEAGSLGDELGTLGEGELKLNIVGVRVLTPRVRAYLLSGVDGSPLPAAEPGAHVTLPIHRPNGEGDTRHFSIASDPDDPMLWEVAVQREDEGLGGSVFIHKHYGIGLKLGCTGPRSGFELHSDARPAVLIGGGIGITPLRSMAFGLKREDRAFEMHYAARSSSDAPYLREMLRDFPGRVRTYWSDLGEAAKMDMERIVMSAPVDAVFYVCGPERLMNAFLALSLSAGLSDDRVRMERFRPPTAAADDQAFEVELRRSGKVFTIPVGMSILDVLLAAGERPSYDCKVGTCGTCSTRVVSGVPDHRDVVLSKLEHERDHLMCTCVSRSEGHLVLDL